MTACGAVEAAVPVVWDWGQGPKHLFGSIATGKGPLLPHGPIGPGAGGLLSRPAILPHPQQAGGIGRRAIPRFGVGFRRLLCVCFVSALRMAGVWQGRVRDGGVTVIFCPGRGGAPDGRRSRPGDQIESFLKIGSGTVRMIAMIPRQNQGT